MFSSKGFGNFFGSGESSGSDGGERPDTGATGEPSGGEICLANKPRD